MAKIIKISVDEINTLIYNVCMINKQKVNNMSKKEYLMLLKGLFLLNASSEMDTKELQDLISKIDKLYQEATK